MAIRSTHCEAHMISKNLKEDHCESLTLCRVHLPLHDTASGFIFWKNEFTKTTTWATANESYIICNLHERSSNCI
nr:unnamed protein product [Ipomoea batatas]